MKNEMLIVKQAKATLEAIVTGIAEDLTRDKICWHGKDAIRASVYRIFAARLVREIEAMDYESLLDEINQDMEGGDLKSDSCVMYKAKCSRAQSLKVKRKSAGPHKDKVERHGDK